jgi:hypothetical protein
MQAFLAGIDSIEQYGENKAAITKKIEEFQEAKKNENRKETDVGSFAKKVSDIAKFCKRDDVTAEAKNAALRSIIANIVYEKANSSIEIDFFPIK